MHAAVPRFFVEPDQVSGGRATLTGIDASHLARALRAVVGETIVIVAYRMLGAPVTVEHGGPVRLYVAPMFGYKSLKWLSAIRVENQVIPGFWEQNGYPVNGWIDGSTGASDPALT